MLKQAAALQTPSESASTPVRGAVVGAYGVLGKRVARHSASAVWVHYVL